MAAAFGCNVWLQRLLCRHCYADIVISYADIVISLYQHVDKELNGAWELAKMNSACCMVGQPASRTPSPPTEASSRAALAPPSCQNMWSLWRVRCPLKKIGTLSWCDWAHQKLNSATAAENITACRCCNMNIFRQMIGCLLTDDHICSGMRLTNSVLCLRPAAQRFMNSEARMTRGPVQSLCA